MSKVSITVLKIKSPTNFGSHLIFKDGTQFLPGLAYNNGVSLEYKIALPVNGAINGSVEFELEDLTDYEMEGTIELASKNGLPIDKYNLLNIEDFSAFYCLVRNLTDSKITICDFSPGSSTAYGSPSNYETVESFETLADAL
jgi:hypothetical protein